MGSIVCGIEIEAEYDESKLNHIEKADYHSDHTVPFSNYFIVEEDGSLSSKDFMAGNVVEFISKPFLLEDYKKVLDDFKEEIDRRGGNGRELSEVLSFNNTTGAHIHITLLNSNKLASTECFFKDNSFNFKGKRIDLQQHTSLKLIEKFNEKIRKKVKEKLPEVFEPFIVDYYRSYAQKITDTDEVNIDKMKYGELGRARYYEFNFTVKGRIECRSFNLRGVKTWKQFFKMYEILMTTVKEVFAKELNNGEAFKEEREIDEEEMMFDNNSKVESEMIIDNQDKIETEIFEEEKTKKVELSFEVEETNIRKVEAI